MAAFRLVVACLAAAPCHFRHGRPRRDAHHDGTRGARCPTASYRASPMPRRPWANCAGGRHGPPRLGRTPASSTSSDPSVPSRTPTTPHPEDCLTSISGPGPPPGPPARNTRSWSFSTAGPSPAGPAPCPVRRRETGPGRGVVAVTVNLPAGGAGIYGPSGASAIPDRACPATTCLSGPAGRPASCENNIAAFGGARKRHVFGQSAGPRPSLHAPDEPRLAGPVPPGVLQSPVGQGALRPCAPRSAAWSRPRRSAGASPRALARTRPRSVGRASGRVRGGHPGRLAARGRSGPGGGRHPVLAHGGRGWWFPGRPADMILGVARQDSPGRRDRGRRGLPVPGRTAAGRGLGGDYRRSWTGGSAGCQKGPGRASRDRGHWPADLERVSRRAGSRPCPVSLARKWAESGTPCFVYRLDRPLPDAALAILATRPGTHPRRSRDAARCGHLSGFRLHALVPGL
jgi:hypothetical protein